MKIIKSLVLICLVLATFGPCYAILGLPTKAEVNAVKVSVADQAQQLVKADVKIADNAKSLVDLTARVGKIEANAQAAVGVNNKQEHTQAGRDISQSQVNSDEVVMQMLTTYKYIIGLLIVQLVGLATGLVVQMIILVKYIASLFQAQITEKDKMVDRERASRDDKDRKADEWKERYIESISGHKTNGLTPGQEEANKVFVETIKAGGEVK